MDFPIASIFAATKCVGAQNPSCEYVPPSPSMPDFDAINFYTQNSKRQTKTNETKK